MKFRPLYRYQPMYAKKFLCTSVYEPLINDRNDLFLMNWTHQSNLFENKYYNEELCKELFNRELLYYDMIKHKPYAPEIEDIDSQKIYIRWYDQILSDMIYHKTIDQIPFWKEKVKEVVDDLENNNIYKVNLYPTTFYLDNKSNIRILDLYGCTDVNKKYISKDIILAITRGEYKERFESAKEGAFYDTLKLYSNTKKVNYGNWPGDFLNDNVCRKLCSSD